MGQIELFNDGQSTIQFVKTNNNTNAFGYIAWKALKNDYAYHVYCVKRIKLLQDVVGLWSLIFSTLIKGVTNEGNTFFQLT